MIAARPGFAKGSQALYQQEGGAKSKGIFCLLRKEY